MAIEYLDEGVTTLASGGWKVAAGTAGSGIADSATLIISKGSANITSSLDWSSLTEGVEYIDIYQTFLGNIGSAAGSLKLDADASSASRISFAGPGSLFLGAKGDNNLITHFFMTARGRAYLTEGTFSNIRFGGGALNVNESTVVTNAYLHGGQSTIGYNGAPIDILDIDGGVHNINRTATGDPGKFWVRGGTCVYDVPTSSTAPGEIRIGSAGTVMLVNCVTPVASVYVDGLLDASRLKSPVTLTTVYYGPNARIIEGNRLTITNRVRGSGSASVAGFLPQPV